MRTNIEIDDELMREAIRLGGFSTKKEAVSEGLRLIVHLKQQAELRALRGKLVWDGVLEDMRRDA